MPAAVDDEGLGHAGRAERELDAAVGVGADRAERIAIGRRGSAARSSRPVADRDAVDRHAAPRERLELRRLGPAGNAPAGEDVDEARLAAREGRRWTGPGGPASAGGSANSGTGWPISCDSIALGRAAS